MGLSMDRVGKTRNAYEILVWKAERKRPIGRPRCGWENDIKIDLKENDGVCCISLAQEKEQWRALAIVVMKFLVSWTEGGGIYVSRRNLVWRVNFLTIRINYCYCKVGINYGYCNVGINYCYWKVGVLQTKSSSYCTSDKFRTQFLLSSPVSSCAWLWFRKPELVV
jgi:hypothetical protein